MTSDHRTRVRPADAGQTLAAIVRRLLDDLPWSKARALCHDGKVEVDGRVVRDHAQRVAAGAEVRVVPQRTRRAPDPAGVVLLHVDHHVVVVDKPAGVMTVPFEGEEDTLVHRVHATLRRRFGPCPPPRVVQRLDKDTTGALVFARTRQAERFLQEQFRAHSAKRTYLALALGRVETETHRSWLVGNRGDGLRGSYAGNKPPAGARVAVTHVERIGHFELPPERLEPSEHPLGRTWVSFVRCRLETGRQHQIRIHLAERGHPLVGERVYVRDYRGAFVRGYAPGQGRPLLHAHTLGFVHPADETERAFVSPIPADLAQMLASLGVDPSGLAG